MSVFKDLVNIWKSEDSLSQAWSESNDMLNLSHEMFKDAIEALRSGEKNKVLKSIKLRERYGENPHQAAAAFQIPGDKSNGILNAKIHQGKKLSYNNIMDADAALSCLKEFKSTACVIVKHANPCGVALGTNMLDVYKRAFAAGSISAFY